MSSSCKLFPPVVRRQTFTDHSVASILAPEAAERQPLPAVAPSGDERRQHELFRVTGEVESRRHPFNNSASTRFDNLGDDSIAEGDADSASRQIGSSSSLAVFSDVDQMTACRRDGGLVHQRHQPWCRYQKNSDNDKRLADRQQTAGSVRCWETGYGIAPENGAKGNSETYRLPLRTGSALINRADRIMRADRKNAEVDAASMLTSVGFQTVGFGTSAGDVAEDRFQDGGGMVIPAGGVLRPTPTFGRPSIALPPGGVPSVDVSPRLELESADLWRLFDEFTTEMVITKSGRLVSGRCVNQA